jgi:molybdate transport system substrate-binding protein
MSLLALAAPAALTLRVFAAASLADAFQEIAAGYEKAHPGVRVELNFAGSQVLRTQIEQGAPADVFASADEVQAEAPARAGLLGARRIFARNRLVVAAPSPAGKVGGLADLARPGARIVVAGPSVPAGRYTTEALAKLGAHGGLGAGFAELVQANVVSHEANVRAVLSKVVLGEADAGFVYATDAATAAGQLRVIEIPSCCNVTAAYPIAVLRHAAAPREAQAFVERVSGPEGQAILRKHGFAP